MASSRVCDADINRVLESVPFPHSELRVKGDLRDASRQAPHLAIKSDDFFDATTFKQMRCICLHGVLSYAHRGGTYNCPVEVYVTPEYPSKAPIAFVRPTSEMRYDAGARYMDSQGCVTTPSTSSWNSSRNISQKAETEFRDLEGERTRFEAAAEAAAGKVRSLQQYVSALEERRTMLDTWTDAHAARLTSLDPEQAIVPAHRLHNQLLTAVAEHAALEDGIDLLKDALEQRRITPHYFVHASRMLATKQFEQRMLAERIAEALEVAAAGAGAPALPGWAGAAPAAASSGPYGGDGAHPAYLMGGPAAGLQRPAAPPAFAPSGMA